MQEFDVIIIGAGVIGCSVARHLSRYDIRVGLIEKYPYVCFGQSKTNGAIIHAGHNSKPGSLKAVLNVRGNRLFPSLCKELGLKFDNRGLFVISLDKKDDTLLDELYHQGSENGVGGLDIIDGSKLRKFEPNLTGLATSALLVPPAGMINTQRFVIALAEDAAVNGVSFIFEQKVEDLLKENDMLVGLKTDKSSYRCRLIINCAGYDSIEIAKKAGYYYNHIPRKGEYYIIDKKYEGLITRPCFPVPTKLGKGITVVPTINGNIIFGGNCTDVGDPYDYSTTREGYIEVFENSKRLVPAIDGKEIITSFAGIRSTSDTDDFIIDDHSEEGIINLAGIDSPGLSASPAIALDILEKIKKTISLRPKKRTEYKIKPLFRELAEEEKREWIKKDKDYGRIICRCEQITEGDIVSAVYSPIPAKNIDAIKFKSWAGTGRCQGAFDIERIIGILEERCGISPLDVNKNVRGSNIVTGRTKEGT
jgi:glycerol-3-phosphate dehydrogenase